MAASASPAKDPVHPAARSGLPRATSTGVSTIGGLAAYLLADNLDPNLLMQGLVFVIVAALGALLPSLRLTNPETRQALTRDSSLASIMGAVVAGLSAAYAAGEIPLPDEARGLFAGVIAWLSGTQVPSLLGTARGGRFRATRGLGAPDDRLP
jgi:uncharacterized membrane protein YfcA